MSKPSETISFLPRDQKGRCESISDLQPHVIMLASLSAAHLAHSGRIFLAFLSKTGLALDGSGSIAAIGFLSCAVQCRYVQMVND
jgi:hypothetical protein